MIIVKQPFSFHGKAFILWLSFIVVLGMTLLMMYFFEMVGFTGLLVLIPALSVSGIVLFFVLKPVLRIFLFPFEWKYSDGFLYNGNFEKPVDVSKCYLISKGIVPKIDEGNRKKIEWSRDFLGVTDSEAELIYNKYLVLLLDDGKILLMNFHDQMLSPKVRVKLEMIQDVVESIVIKTK